MEAIDLEKELQELQQMSECERRLKLDQLRLVFAPKAVEIKELEAKAAKIRAELKAIEDAVDAKINEVAALWRPHIQGVDKATMNFDNGLSLVAETKLNISTEDQDKATEWFLGNGYEGVMKWQIHDQTKKKIARDHYEKGEEIPGLKYSKFTLVKVGK